MIEILGVGQQFISDGMHPSGSRYQWNGTALPEMAGPSTATLESLLEMLELCFGLEPWKITREKRPGTEVQMQDDPVADWLTENWETYDGSGPQIDILCPFAKGHSSTSGTTSTSYFPAGTGGYAQGHFVCLHASCTGREDRDFLASTGYTASLFSDLGDVQLGGRSTLNLTTDSKGGVLATQDNLVKLCGNPLSIEKVLAYDCFKDEMVWAPDGELPEQWRPFRDVDYTDIRIRLERVGCKPMTNDMVLYFIIRAAQ